MKNLIKLSIITILISKSVFAQENKLSENIAMKGKKECKFYTNSSDEIQYSEWDGKCKKGFVEGEGTIKLYSDNKESLAIIQTTFKGGIMEGKSEVSNYINNKLLRKATRIYSQGQITGDEIGNFLTGNENEIKTGELFGTYKIKWVNDGQLGVGIWNQKEGSKYEGEFKNGSFAPNGKGKITYIDGDTYEGEMKLGKKDGYGIYKNKDHTLTGEFSNDKFEGQGTAEYSNKSKYVGQWKDNKYNGKGTYSTEYGILDAVFFDYKVSGKGTYTYKNGGVYKGDFNADYQHDGYGILTYADGDTFEGEFRKGSMKKGLYTGKGFTYDGSFNDKGHFFGKGILTKTDSQSIKKIVANFTNNDEGDGKIYYNDGALYDGKFVNNQRNGFGTFTEQKIRYTGDFVNNVMEGKFITYMGDVDDEIDKVEGSYINSVLNGIVTVHYKKGEVIKLFYNNGKTDHQASVKLNTIPSSGDTNNNSFRFGIYKVHPQLSNYSSFYIMFNKKHTVITFIGSSPSDIQDQSNWKSGGGFIFKGNKINITFSSPKKSTAEWEIMSDGTLRNGDSYLTFVSPN